MADYLAQKSRLARTSLSCQEKRATGEVDNLEGVLPLLVIEIQLLAIQQVVL